VPAFKLFSLVISEDASHLISSYLIHYLPSDCRVALTANVSEHFNSTMGNDQTTTPGTTCPTLYDECVGSLTSPVDHNNEDAGHWAYSFYLFILPHKQ